MRKENKGKIKNSETGAVLIKKIAIHIFLLQLKICTKIRGIFMLNPPPYVKEEQEENQGNRRFFIKEKFRSDFLAATEFFYKKPPQGSKFNKKVEF